MKKLLIVSVLLSIAVGYGLAVVLGGANSMPMTADKGNAETRPLYWVAPMDDSYRRDKPGKSPMGMDLVAVFAKPAGAADGPGVVTISAAVENNLSVRTTQLKLGSLSAKIKTVGYVQYDQDRIVHAHPRVEGWVESLVVKAMGEPVQKGQRLYSLYSPELVAAQDELVLALKRNQPGLVAAAERRLASLHISPAFIKQLKRSRKVKQNVAFYAPQSGVVNQLKIREGFYVKPGDTLMSIAALDEVWVEAEVFARQAGQVQAGLAVSMRLDYFPAERWQGKVDYIYPMLDDSTRTLRIRLRFNNKDRRLKPNMFASVEISTMDNGPVLLLPREALIRTGQQDRVVLALGEGRFKSVAVSVGAADDDFFEVLSGLKPGERVVSSAQFLLDSESSKSSDFKRLEAPAAGAMMQGHNHD